MYVFAQKLRDFLSFCHQTDERCRVLPFQDLAETISEKRGGVGMPNLNYLMSSVQLDDSVGGHGGHSY